MAWESTVVVRNAHGGTKTLKITTSGATMAEIAAAVENLGHLPTSIVSSASKKTATKIKQAARGVAPKRTGALRSGIVVSRKKERSKVRGKAVWDVWIDSAMNDTFQRPSSGQRGGYAYYPSSMEYGFKTRDGKKYAGFGYMHSAAEAFEGIHNDLVISEVSKKLDALWAKKQAEQSGGE